MKKILLLISLCCLGVTLRAQSLKTSDLAYPKTVQEEAAKALKKAEKKGDGDLLVAALCQLSLADCAISKENNEKVLERLHQYQAKEKRVDIQTLLYLLEVRMCEDIWGDYAKRDSVLALCKQPGEEVLSQYLLSAYKESVDPGSKEAQKYVRNLWQMLCPDDPLRLAQDLMDNRWSIDKNTVKEYEDYLENYPEGPYAQQIETAIHHYYRHVMHLSCEDAYPSHQPVTVELKASNVSEATVVVYALPDTLNTLVFDQSRGKIEYPVKEVVRRSVTFSPNSDMQDTAKIDLGCLPYGVYCIDYYEEAHPHKPLKTFKRGIAEYFCVSDLYPVSVADYTKGTHSEMVVDTWSGKPLDDVIFENGYPKRGNDRFCQNRIKEEVDRYEYSPSRVDNVKFFSDLAIYRPGEQVRWHLVAYVPRLYTHAVDPDALFKVTVLDANGEELRCDTVTTDVMGQARGSFVLPKGDKVPLGTYSIKVLQLGLENEYIAPYSFEVAEYKAPTFLVSIDRFASKYLRSDTVQIAGSVATLVGVPMRGQVVKLRVDGGEKSIVHELTTDKAGRFSMQFPMSGFFADSTQWRYWHWFSATVSVTNAGGESQEAQAGFHYVPDKKPYAPTREMPDTCPAGVPLWMRIADYRLESDADFNAVIPIYNSVPNTYIHYLAYDRDKILFDDWVHYADTGRHELRLPMLRKGSKVEMTVELFSRYQGKNYSCVPTVHLKERKLMVETEVMRDHIAPGVTETWRLRAHYDDEKCTPAQARLMLLLYHSALAQLRENRWTFQANVDRGPMVASFMRSYSYFRWMPSYEWTEPTLRKKIEMRLPQLQTWGNKFRFSHPIYIRGNAKVHYRLQDADFVEDDVVVDLSADSGVYEEEEAEENRVFCAVEDSPVFNVRGESSYPSIASTVQMRDSMTHVALYEPALDTDAEGRATVTFNVPQDNATWLLEAVVYDCALHTADLHKKIVVQRPMMVKPSLPRFLRMGDHCTLSGLVQNASTSTIEATVQVEIFHPLSKEVLLQRTEQMQLAVNEERSLGITLQVPDSLDQLGFRIVAIAGEGEERCSDGEQLRLPVLPAAQPIVDSYPFYRSSPSLLRKEGDIQSQLEGIKDSLWHVAGCPEKYAFEAVNNVADYLKPQLLQVYDKDASTATDIAHSLWAKVVVSNLLVANNPDSLLTKEGWGGSVGDNSSLIERLNGLQNGDGGYSWCDYKNRRSSEYVTSTVMYLMERLEKMGYEVPEGLHLDRARQYLKDSTQYYSHTWRKKWFIRCHWKKMSLADRGFAAQFLNENASGIIGCFNRRTARRIARSIMEYQKEDEYYGGYWSIEHARIWNMPLGCCCCIWRPLLYHDQLALTAHLTEVLNEVDPVKYRDAIERSRQWMMMSKRTTDWGNSSLVADAAFALLRTGDVWDESNHPVWGALTVTKQVPVCEVEKHGMHEVSVDVKPLENLEVGKKIKVEVQIEVTQSMDYVTITIPRPACLEPLRQTSGLFWQSGLWGRSETRDTETRLYIPHLTAGKHSLSFEAYVTHEGEFAQPAVTLTCEYNPHFTVHSSGKCVEVKFP